MGARARVRPAGARGTGTARRRIAPIHRRATDGQGVKNIKIDLIKIVVVDEDGMTRQYGGRYIGAAELFADGDPQRYNSWERTRRARKGLPKQPRRVMVSRGDH